MATKKTEGLSFKDSDQRSAVYLDGKRVGSILKVAFNGGWFYSPKGTDAKGEVMPTRAAVKESLK